MRRPRSCSWPRCPAAAGLSRSDTVMNTVPALGRRAPAAAWALAKAVGKSRPTPMTSPVERISGPSSASEPANRSKGSTASLTATWSPRHRVGGQAEVGELRAEHDPAGHLGQRHPGRLAHERHRPRRAGVGLDHVELAAVDGELDVEQADDAEGRGRCRASARGWRRASRARASAAAARRPSRPSARRPPRRAA